MTVRLAQESNDKGIRVFIKSWFPFKGFFLLLLSGAIYGLLFSIMYSIMGIVVPLIGFVVVALFGWSFGAGMGIIAGVLFGALDNSLLTQFEIVVMPEKVLGFLFEIGIGGVFGWVGAL